MARSEITVSVNIGDIDRFRLLAFELRQIGDRMAEDGCEHAELFMAAIDRFASASSRDDRPDE